MLIYVDTSDVRDGALAELKWAIEELAAYVGNAQRRMLAYSAFFCDDGRRMTVVHVHPDAASLDDFMTLAGSRFERFAELLALKAIDVYGQPTDDALRRLREKASLLGGNGVAVHALHAGSVESTASKLSRAAPAGLSPRPPAPWRASPASVRAHA